MPPVFAAIGSILFAIGAPLAVVNFVTIGLGATLLQAGLALGISYLAQQLLVQKPKVPKPDDGKYNLKQPVPSRARIYGRVKKAGDYLCLEERDGVAYHVLCHAAHRIQGYVEHWLHDEKVTLNVSGVVTAPTHFNQKVTILSRLGIEAETAYAPLVTALPEIWTADHRGDGIATVMMRAASVSNEDYLDVYPQQMPAHSAVIDGALVYDPRTETTGFSANLALIRLDHLLHPSGGKLSIEDIHLPDWIAAANVCDQLVANRQGEQEPRYHGGIWYRYENDPVEVGRLIDQAAELVLYETADGKIGVHAGAFVMPDIRLDERDLLAVSFDANRRRASTVIAVRGRYTDPANGYNTTDAAIYGDPYASDETERTRTVDNQVVQSHNHSNRLQKLAYIRANAPRVTVRANYRAAWNVPFWRFVKVHYPPRLDEAILEIIDRPRLSLANLTVEFTGILVDEDLYGFDADTEEGEPGAEIIQIGSSGVPVPENFGIQILTETIGGGQIASYALASWDHVSDALTYELEWQPTAGGPATTTTSTPGEDEVRTTTLADGAQYRFRLRAWSGGGNKSDYTGYITQTITSDPTPPGEPDDVSGDGGLGDATVVWTTPNSANFAASRVYRNTASSFGTATLVNQIFSAPSAARSFVDTGLAAGTYYYWVTSINWSGVESDEVATGAVTVT